MNAFILGILQNYVLLDITQMAFQKHVLHVEMVIIVIQVPTQVFFHTTYALLATIAPMSTMYQLKILVQLERMVKLEGNLLRLMHVLLVLQDIIAQSEPSFLWDVNVDITALMALQMLTNIHAHQAIIRQYMQLHPILIAKEQVILRNALQEHIAQLALQFHMIAHQDISVDQELEPFHLA
jgi:hypothetical protein